MNRFLITEIVIIVSCLIATVSGCIANPKPDVPEAAYGKVVDQFPDIPKANTLYKFPVKLDHIRQ